MRDLINESPDNFPQNGWLAHFRKVKAISSLQWNHPVDQPRSTDAPPESGHENQVNQPAQAQSQAGDGGQIRGQASRLFQTGPCDVKRR